MSELMAAKTYVFLFSIFIAGVAILGFYHWNPAYASLSASPFNATNKDEANVDPDWFDIKGELKKNKGSAVDRYDVKKFDIVLSNSSYLCPTNDCEFTFKHAESGQGLEIKDAYDRQFEGTLKVKKDGKSKIYEVIGFWQVTGIDSDQQELTGDTYISVGEDLSLGDGINDKEYQTNGTLIWKNDRNNAELTIHGDRVQN